MRFEPAVRSEGYHEARHARHAVHPVAGTKFPGRANYDFAHRTQDFVWREPIPGAAPAPIEPAVFHGNLVETGFVEDEALARAVAA